MAKINWGVEYDRIAGLRDTGASTREIAEYYGVSTRTIQRGLKEKGPGSDSAVQLPDYQWPERLDWREWFGEWEKILEMHKKQDPYAQQFTIDLGERDRPFALASASDLHLGGGFTSHSALREHMEYIIETPDLHLGITGDSIEGFLPGVKPAETIEQQPSNIKSQLWALESLVDELVEADTLRWMTWGDHDGIWFEKTIGVGLVKEMVKSKVPYFVGRGLIRLKINDQEYFLLVNHAERSRSQWSNTHGARKAYEAVFPADVVITGHTHKPEFRMFTHYQELRDAGINLGGKAWLVQNGTFKDGPDPYTIRSWTRGVIGVPTIVFAHDRHDVDVFQTPRKAMQYIEGGSY